MKKEEAYIMIYDSDGFVVDSDVVTIPGDTWTWFCNTCGASHTISIDGYGEYEDECDCGEKFWAEVIEK